MPTPSSRSLVFLELAKHRSLKASLREKLPDIDDETLADTLEGISDLREMLAELVRSALEDDALFAGLSTRLAEMRSRLERLKLQAEKNSALALAAMTEAEIKSFIERSHNHPSSTASLFSQL